MIQMYEIKGINENGANVSSIEFPPNEFNLNGGTMLVATSDMPFFDIKKDKPFHIVFDGRCIRSGGMSWTVEGLTDEIKKGVWEIAV